MRSCSYSRWKCCNSILATALVFPAFLYQYKFCTFFRPNTTKTRLNLSKSCKMSEKLMAIFLQNVGRCLICCRRNTQIEYQRQLNHLKCVIHGQFTFGQSINLTHLYAKYSIVALVLFSLFIFFFSLLSFIGKANVTPDFVYHEIFPVEFVVIIIRKYYYQHFDTFSKSYFIMHNLSIKTIWSTVESSLPLFL